MCDWRNNVRYPDGDRRLPNPLVILPDPPSPPTAIGLIAGAGRLPIIVAEGLRDIGHRIHGIGLAHMYEPELPEMCDSFHEVGLFRVGGWGRALSRRNVRHAIMVGKVDKAKLMHDPLRMMRHVPDLRTMIAWHRKLRHDRRSYAVLGAIADELERSGVQLLETMSAEGLRVPNIWAMSAYVSDEEALAALSLGAGEFINKPFDLDHLDFTLQLLSPML